MAREKQIQVVEDSPSGSSLRCQITKDTLYAFKDAQMQCVRLAPVALAMKEA